MKTHIDVDAVNDLIERGYISRQKHPTEELYIYNYTHKTQFDNFWNEHTKMCRGLITDENGKILYRGFDKFFNLDDTTNFPSIPQEPFTVREKMDGSYIITYFIDHQPHFASRGSFTSDYALRAEDIFKKKFSHVVFPDERLSYIFEVIAPELRIVVDYHGREDLVLLAVIDPETGKELPLDDFASIGFPIPKLYNFKEVEEIFGIQEEDEEGFVIRFESGLRGKCKYENYKRLHKILTGCTSRTIWEYLKEERSIAELIDRVPDEFYNYVKDRTRYFSDRYEDLYRRAKQAYQAIIADVQVQMPIKVDDVLVFKDFKRINGVMETELMRRFAEYEDVGAFAQMIYKRNHKDQIREAIWKSLYPPAEKPFKIDEA